MGGLTAGEEAGGDHETSRATLGSRSIPRLLWFLQCVIEAEHTLQALCLEDGHWVTSLFWLHLCTKPGRFLPWKPATIGQKEGKAAGNRLETQDRRTLCWAVLTLCWEVLGRAG